MFDRGVSQQALMERAGVAVAREVHRYAHNRPVLVLAGSGNNGDDAFITAKVLREWGHDVRVAATGPGASGGARHARPGWTGGTDDIASVASRPILVDGLFGIGLSRPIDSKLASQLSRLTDAAETIIAVDIPSGTDPDARFDHPHALRADITVALGALNPAHLMFAGAAGCGLIRLAEIGVDVPSTVRTIVRPRIAAPARDAHKYSRGLVAVIGGAMPGAARLSARSALTAGVGYVILTGDTGRGGPDALVRRSANTREQLDDVIGDRRIGALLLGPGLGRGEHASMCIEAAIASDRTLVLDGDALSVLGAQAVARLSPREATTILTPHEGEFDRMFPKQPGNKIERSIAAARKCNATIVHKGAVTVIARPDGTAIVAADGSSWLSTAGTGDVLAGTIAARVAVVDAKVGCVEAVWLHGRAATLAGPAFIADDLIATLAPAIGECR